MNVEDYFYKWLEGSVPYTSQTRKEMLEKEKVNIGYLKWAFTFGYFSGLDKAKEVFTEDR